MKKKDELNSDGDYLALRLFIRNHCINIHKEDRHLLYRRRLEKDCSRIVKVYLFLRIHMKNERKH